MSETKEDDTMAQRARSRRVTGADAGAVTSKPLGEPELIVIARPEVGLRAAGRAVTAMAPVNLGGVNELLRREGIALTPLFGSTEDRVRVASMTVFAQPGPDLSVYYRVEAPPERMGAIVERLAQHEAFAGAYIKPPAEPAQINDMVATPEPPPPVTPDLTSRQFYLDVAPAGIDARFAWTRPGGAGTNVRIVDIEGAWRFSHEDLTQNQGGVVGGAQSTDIGWRNHGTAVIGVIGGDRNAVGVTGIAPDANQRAISIFGAGQGSAKSIRDAADRLSAGDVILIELHRPGPRHNFQSRNDQGGYIAVEWWPDDWAAVQYATARGVIVVEAAGNGAENLDDAIYNTPAPGFPSGWTNPFNRVNRDSGAIVVGAGAPPPGTHGRDWGPDRSRLDFSNFGSCLDVQGVGREVTTCGYGDLQGGMNEDEWYTDTFSGTSSSSPIVVGAIACVQGVLEAAGRPRLSPAQARQHLRNTGSAQQDAPGRPATQRIGRRPDLRALIGAVMPKGIGPKEITKEGKERIKERKELKIEAKEGGKEFKLEKIELKERKEGKEFAKDRKDLFEGARFTGGGGAQATGVATPDLDTRIGDLERVVSQLAHFITSEARPDLSTGALGNEPDVGMSEAQALSAQLQAAATQAKASKDAKDLEKLREG